MKTFYNISAMLMLSLAMISCEKESIPTHTQGMNNEIKLNVSDKGFRTNSRAGENNNYNVSFEKGDAIGLFLISADGESNVTNQKIEYGESGWQMPQGVTIDEGMKIFAYHPYTETLPEGSYNIQAENADDFFSGLVSGWKTSNPENIIDDFKKYDLMTGEGSLTKTESEIQLSIPLSHKMGMIVVKTAIGHSEMKVAGITPFNASGEYRALLNPNALPSEMYITYKDDSGILKEWTISAPAQATYNIYNIGNNGN